MVSAFRPGNLGTARGEIEIGTSQLAGVEQRTRTVGQNVRRNLEQVGDGARKAEQDLKRMGSPSIIQGFDRLGSAIQDVSGLFAIQLARGALTALINLTDLRNEAIRTGIAFEILAGNADVAEARIRAVVDASADTVTTMEAQAIATQAASLNLATTSEELIRLTRAARAVTIVSPVINDMTSAISELGLASANLSFQRLDQLGLTVSEVKARMAELEQETEGLDESQIFLQASVELLNEKYADLIDREELAGSGMDRLRTASREYRIELAQQTGWLDALAGLMARRANDVRTFREAIELLQREHLKLSPAQRDVIEELEHLQRETFGFQLAGRETADIVEELIDLFFQLAEAERAAAEAEPEMERGGRRLFRERPGVVESLQRRRREAREQAQAIADIDEEFRDDQRDAIEEFERDRVRTIRDHERDIARDAEDFARDRQRNAEELNRQIADIRQEQHEQEVEAREGLNERIAEIQERFSRDLARAERDHRDNLLDAAARLDARAVAEEQSRFRRQREDLVESRDDQVEAEREAHQDRLQLERESAEERIADLRESLAERQRIEDEDRAIRLRRQQEDFQRQLQEDAASHGRRLQELREFHDEALAEQREFQEESLRQWREARGKIPSLVPQTGGSGAQPILPRPTPERFEAFQHGGFVDRNMLAFLHRGEFVMPAGQVDSSRQQPVSGPSLNVASGAFVINGATNPGAVGESIEDALLRILERMA